jgi:hypothetical protein
VTKKTKCTLYLIKTLLENDCSTNKYYVGLPNIYSKDIRNNVLDIVFEYYPILVLFDKQIDRKIKHETYSITGEKSYLCSYSDFDLQLNNKSDPIKYLMLADLKINTSLSNLTLGNNIAMIEIDADIFNIILSMPQELINKISNYVALRSGFVIPTELCVLVTVVN